ncbi:MAG TPA: nitrate reductase molybdenum cofactor assembly chaperone [Bacillota bacterium]|nr:nitrate reductase molybdenum cofactor assembly chaperone [Bacillota bacterium]
MIDLEKLSEQKHVFRFFSNHLSYPETDPFVGERLEDVIPPTHPSYLYVKRYYDEMYEHKLYTLRTKYIETFDFQKDTTLYMTYIKFEDSKERGQMLARLKVLYEMFGLYMPDGELSDYLPLMCEFIFAADWQGDSRAEQSFSLLLAVLEDGSYHLMKALEKHDSPFLHLVKGMRETFKVCIVQEGVGAND